MSPLEPPVEPYPESPAESSAEPSAERASEPDDRRLFRQACEHLAEDSPEANAAAEALLLKLIDTPVASAAGRRLPDLGSYLAQLALGRDNDWVLDVKSAATLLLSRLWWEQERRDAALDLLGSRLQGAPWAEGYHQLARWRLELGFGEEAVSALGQALQQDPAYLPAYEDLAWFANREGDSDLAYKIVQQGMAYELSPRLFEELLIASSRADYIPMRSLFLELCVRRVTPETRPLLMPLLHKLYAEGDYHHAAYLGSHLLQAFPAEREVLSVYVLSALQQQQYVPALQALLQAPDAFFRQGEHWYKLGIAYGLWQMPDFARHALNKARSLTPGLEKEILPRLNSLPPDLKPLERLNDLIKQILKQMLLQPEFSLSLRREPEKTLLRWGLPVADELLEAVLALPDPGLSTTEGHAMMHPPEGTDGEEQDSEGDTSPL